ncbi:MAG: hypothetical protein SGBAC_007488 [Bacillariaceae sp.]
MRALNQYISEEENGFMCVWVYSSGDLSDFDDVDKEKMPKSSLSSIPKSDEEREQEEVDKDTSVEAEKRTVPKRGPALSSSLAQARKRHLENQRSESREARRSLVRSSVLSLSRH